MTYYYVLRHNYYESIVSVSDLIMLPQFEIREHRLRFADPNISGSYAHKEVGGIEFSSGL